MAGHGGGLAEAPPSTLWREGWRVEVVIANPSSTAFSGFIRDYIAPGKAIFSFGARAVSELGLPKLEIGE